MEDQTMVMCYQPRSPLGPIYDNLDAPARIGQKRKRSTFDDMDDLNYEHGRGKKTLKLDLPAIESKILFICNKIVSIDNVLTSFPFK
jgi:hypothetical protein